MCNAAVIIPTFNPGNNLIELVTELCRYPFHEIIIVNDGSNDPASGNIFHQLAQYPVCRILTHEKNQGKGAALKSGFADYLARNPEGIGCITTDDDGQHAAADIHRIALAFEKNPTALHLGCRNFEKSVVPWKSRFGNKVTRAVFRTISGQNISDTQTGLRAIPADVMKSALAIRCDHFEFEMEMLLRAGENAIPIREIPIQTIYRENNAGSRFRPLKDSVQIYGVIFHRLLHQFCRFLISALSSAILDLLLFTLFIHLFAAMASQDGKYALPVLGICAAARIISAVWNYLLNRYWVFPAEKKGRGGTGKSVLGYFLLCIFIFALSGTATSLLALTVPLTALPYWKAGIDVLLFLLSFLVQKTAVFRTRYSQ